jgi:predicted PurR-regulated permease PerM
MAADHDKSRNAAAADDRDRRVELRIPFATLLKIALFVLLVVIAIQLWPLIVMVIVAVLLAVMLDPLVAWFERHRVRRGIAIALIAIALFGSVAAFVFSVVPAMVSQLQDLAQALPRIAARVSQAVPQAKPVIDGLVADAGRPLSAAQVQQWLTRGLIAGRFAAAGLAAVVLVIVMALYFLAEGRRVIEWLIAFAPPRQRSKIRTTLRQVDPIVFAYMRGQIITCTLCGSVALTTALVLDIPGAVPLAVLAFVADLVPVVGTIAMTVPAVAVAFVVSGVKAVIVLVVYLAYHLIESYWIIPRVYGTEMRLSTLTVLLAVLAGGILQGALGAVLILPFVAAYRVVERVWLAEYLSDTVEKHELDESRNEP